MLLEGVEVGETEEITMLKLLGALLARQLGRRKGRQ